MAGRGYEPRLPWRTLDPGMPASSLNGIGIDPKHADRVFQVFQRLHTRKDYPGTGNWPDDLQENRGASRRSDMGSVPAGPGATFHFTIGRTENRYGEHPDGEAH